MSNCKEEIFEYYFVFNKNEKANIDNLFIGDPVQIVGNTLTTVGDNPKILGKEEDILCLDEDLVIRTINASLKANIISHNSRIGIPKIITSYDIGQYHCNCEVVGFVKDTIIVRPTDIISLLSIKITSTGDLCCSNIKSNHLINSNITLSTEDLAENCREGEESIMDNLFGSMGFGKFKGNRFALSMNGIAVLQPNGKYVVYKADTNEFIDVENTIINIKDGLFLLPAVEVAAGDTVLHEGKPYYITSTRGGIKAVSYEDCTEATLIPKTTMFGIKYFTKVCSLFGDNFAQNKEMFSNPMFLMALMDGKESDLSKLMLLSNLGSGKEMNPLALMLLTKGEGKSDLSTIALMSMLNNGTNIFNTNSKVNTVKEN